MRAVVDLRKSAKAHCPKSGEFLRRFPIPSPGKSEKVRSYREIHAEFQLFGTF
jgi:hypothetical protein